MKVSAALTLALAGASIASPIGIEEREIEAREIEAREIEARAFTLIPVLMPSLASSVPVSIPPIAGAPIAPQPALAPNDIVPALITILQSLITTITNLIQGLPGNTATPPTTITNVTGLAPVAPSIAAGSLTPSQLVPMALALQYQLGNFSAITGNLPTGLNATQLAFVQNAVVGLRALLNPILSTNGTLPTLGNLQGALPGGVPNLQALQSLVTGLTAILSVVTTLLAAVTSLIPGVGAGRGLGV